MQEKPARKYQVIEEAEIDLVLRCRDSHEFYEQYLVAFPGTQKGIDTIARIWKRKSEFAKKRQPVLPPAGTGATTPPGFAALIAEQTAIMREISALTRENIETNKQILTALAYQNDILSGHIPREPHRDPVPQAPAIPRTLQEKPPGELAPVMVAS